MDSGPLQWRYLDSRELLRPLRWSHSQDGIRTTTMEIFGLTRVTQTSTMESLPGWIPDHYNGDIWTHESYSDLYDGVTPRMDSGPLQWRYLDSRELLRPLRWSHSQDGIRTTTMEIFGLTRVTQTSTMESLPGWNPDHYNGVIWTHEMAHSHLYNGVIWTHEMAHSDMESHNTYGQYCISYKEND